MLWEEVLVYQSAIAVVMLHNKHPRQTHMAGAQNPAAFGEFNLMRLTWQVCG